MSTESAQIESPSLERKLFRLTLLVFAGLFVGAFIPIFGLIISIPFSCIALLWCYTAVVVATLVFPIAFLLANRRKCKPTHSIASAARWSVIACGVLGVAL